MGMVKHDARHLSNDLIFGEFVRLGGGHVRPYYGA